MMERLKIMLVVAGIAIGDQNGGAEYFAVQLARQLDKSQFEPLVFAMWQYGSPAERHWLTILNEERVPVAGLTPSRGSIFRELQDIYARMWSTTNAFTPVIINSHSQRGDIPNILLHMFHPSRPHSLRTIHIDQPWLNRLYLDLIFDKVVFPFCFDGEIAISEIVHQKLDRRLFARILRKKSMLCYNGISAEIFEYQCSKESLPGLPEQRPCIGVVGRLTKQKGHSDLLDAVKLILQRQPVHLWVIGSGPLEAELRQQAIRLGIKDYIHFLGPRGDVLDILPHLNMMVSSSLWEGLPTVLLEAMALGVPVVATDVSGSRELIRNGVTGLLVPSRSPNHLAEAVLEMLNHPNQAHEMAQAAHQHAKIYTIQNAVQKYVQIYKQLCRRQ